MMDATKRCGVWKAEGPYSQVLGQREFAGTKSFPGPRMALPSSSDLENVAPRVVFDSEASSTATLVEIVAEDRPGLLYDLATAISANGGNIEVVLIDTQAHKAIDVF